MLDRAVFEPAVRRVNPAAARARSPAPASDAPPVVERWIARAAVAIYLGTVTLGGWVIVRAVAG